MTDLDAAIRGRVAEIAAENDDDCNMQRGVSCASQGYNDIARGLLTVLDVHKRNESGDCTECLTGTPDYEVEGHVRYPCPTVLAVATALEIEL